MFPLRHHQLFYLVFICMLSPQKIPGQPEMIYQGGHAGYINRFAVSHNQKYLATGGEDGAVLVRNLNDEFIAYRLVKSRSGIHSIAFHDSDTILASNDENGHVIIWNMRNETPLKEFDLLIAEKYLYSGWTINTAELLFRGDELLIGLNNPHKESPSPLYQVNLSDTSIKIFHDIPEDDLAGWWGIQKMELLNDRQAVLWLNVSLSSKSRIVLYDLEKDKIIRVFLSSEEIRDFAISGEEPAKLAISRDLAMGGETLIFYLNGSDKDFSIPYGGDLTWEKNIIWISFLDEIKAFDTGEKEFRDYLFTLNMGDQIQWLSSYNLLLHLNRFKGITRYYPLRLNKVGELDKFKMASLRDPFDRKYYMNRMIPLNDSIVLLDIMNTDDYEDKIYRWNQDNDELQEIQMNRYAGIRTIDEKDKIIFGNYLDTSAVGSIIYGNRPFEQGSEKSGPAVPENDSRWSVAGFNDNLVFVQPSLDIVTLIHETGEEKENITVLNYITGDTLYHSGHNLHALFASFEPYSENLVISSKEKDKEILNFYNKDQKDPVYSIQAERLEIVAFDGKQRILLRKDHKDLYVINLSCPDKMMHPDYYGGDVECAVFHPYEPWLFIGGDPVGRQAIECFNYSDGTSVGGASLNFKNKDDEGLLHVKSLLLNNKATKLTAQLTNDVVISYNITGWGFSSQQESSVAPVTWLQQKSNCLYIQQDLSGSNIYRLDDLKRINNSDPSVTGKGNNNNCLQEVVSLSDYGYASLRFMQESGDEISTLKLDSWDQEGHLLESRLIENDHDFEVYSLISRIVDNRYALFNREISYYQQNPGYHGLLIYDLLDEKVLLEDPEIRYQDIIAGGPDMLYFYNNQTVAEWKKGTNKIEDFNIASKYLILGDNKAGLIIQDDSKKLMKTDVFDLEVYDIDSRELIDSIPLPEKFSAVYRIASVYPDKLWACVYVPEDISYALASLNIEEKKWGAGYIKLPAQVIYMIPSEDKRFLILSLENGEVRFHDAATGSFVMKFFFSTKGDFFGTDTAGNFFTSNPQLQPFLLRSEDQIFEYSSFDVSKNHPDIILGELGYSGPETIEVYKNAVEKRITYVQGEGNRSMSDTVSAWFTFNNIPEYYTVNEEQFKLDVSIHGDLYLLNKIAWEVNGFPDSKETGQETDISIPLSLKQGRNVIKVYPVNRQGIRQPAQVLRLMSTVEQDKRQLIICVISVSGYKDSTMNLSFAVKDGRDIIELFKLQKLNYDTVRIYKLLDEEVQKEKISTFFHAIKDVSVNDRMIFFFSGHGLLDADGDFYYATYDTDFDDPAVRGLSFDQLQTCLNELPAQEKLLLIDACHSGLYDKDREYPKKEKNSSSETTMVLANDFSSKGAKVLIRDQLSLQSSFELMQELFSDLTNQSGIETITAASGDSWALESARWKNGAFTFCLKKALILREADSNRNGLITVEELKAYLIRAVGELTNGAQKPTSRQSNQYLNWPVWL